MKTFHTIAECSALLKLISVLLIIVLMNSPTVGGLVGYGLGSKNFSDIVGYYFRISAVEYLPILRITKRQNGTCCLYTGTSVEVFDYICTALKLNCYFVHLNQSEVDNYGAVVSGIRAVSRKEVDVTSSGLVIGAIREEYDMDMSFPILMQEMRLLVPFPGEESRLLALVRPFQLPVWICFVACTVLVIPVLNVLSRVFRKFIDVKDSDSLRKIRASWNELGYCTMYVLTIIALQGNCTLLQQTSFRLAVGAFGLMAFVIINAYASTLIANLTVPKLNPVVNTLEELAASSQYKLLIEMNSGLANRLMEAPDGPRKKLGDFLRNNPTSYITDPKNRIKQMNSGPYVYPVFSPFFSYPLIDAAYKQAGGHCSHTIAKKPLSVFSPIVYGLEKDGVFTTAVNQKILLMQETGLLNHWLSKYMPRVDQCLLENQNKKGKKNKSLSLIDLSGSFVILGGGTCLAIFAFFIELLYFKCINSFKKFPRNIVDVSGKVHY